MNVEIKSLQLIRQLVQMAMEITAIPSLTRFVCMSLRLCIIGLCVCVCYAFCSKTTPLYSFVVNHIVYPQGLNVVYYCVMGPGFIMQRVHGVHLRPIIQRNMMAVCYPFRSFSLKCVFIGKMFPCGSLLHCDQTHSQPRYGGLATDQKLSADVWAVSSDWDDHGVYKKP